VRRSMIYFDSTAGGRRIIRSFLLSSSSAPAPVFRWVNKTFFTISTCDFLPFGRFRCRFYYELFRLRKIVFRITLSTNFDRECLFGKELSPTLEH
jgi:hypothetical protein